MKPICPKCHGNHFYMMHDKRIQCDCEGYDEINKPIHYNNGGDEPYPFIESWDMNYAEGNVIKYVVRYHTKGGVKDLKKARWYLDKLIAEAEKNDF